MSQIFLISNDPLYTIHFNSIFDELWKNGIDAEDRIRDIEVGAEWADVEVIPMSSRARDLYLNLVKKAESEIIIMFPTTNAFIRQKNLGVIQFSEEAARERDVKVRILMPSHESTEDIVQHLKENYAESIDIRYIEKTSDTKATILLVDRKVSLVMELRDNSKRTFDEAIGLSTYSNSRPGVLSYVSIFENLWKQTELYEQLKIHDRVAAGIYQCSRIQSVINNFSNELSMEKVHLVFKPSQKEPIFVNADRVRIFEVISNLLSNAIKFTAEGTILVSVEKDKAGYINNNKAIVVSVKDSGQGMDLSILPRLFTKFASKSYKGT